jgi:hypothetical protein
MYTFTFIITYLHSKYNLKKIVKIEKQIAALFVLVNWENLRCTQIIFQKMNARE